MTPTDLIDASKPQPQQIPAAGYLPPKGSGWSTCLKFMAVLSILLSGVGVILMGNNQEQMGFITIISSISGAISLFICAHIIDILADIRWYAALSAGAVQNKD